MPDYYQYNDGKDMYYFETRDGEKEYRVYGRFEDEPGDSWYPAKKNGKVKSADAIDEAKEYYTLAPLRYVISNPEEFSRDDKTWKEFIKEYPELSANAENMMFLPYYSETMEKPYPYETFGAWEWSDLSDEENPLISYFIYGYIDNLSPSAATASEAQESHWIQVAGSDISAYLGQSNNGDLPSNLKITKQEYDKTTGTLNLWYTYQANNTEHTTSSWGEQYSDIYPVLIFDNTSDAVVKVGSDYGLYSDRGSSTSVWDEFSPILLKNPVTGADEQLNDLLGYGNWAKAYQLELDQVGTPYYGYNAGVGTIKNDTRYYYDDDKIEKPSDGNRWYTISDKVTQYAETPFNGVGGFSTTGKKTIEPFATMIVNEKGTVTELKPQHGESYSYYYYNSNVEVRIQITGLDKTFTGLYFIGHSKKYFSNGPQGQYQTMSGYIQLNSMAKGYDYTARYVSASGRQLRANSSGKADQNNNFTVTPPAIAGYTTPSAQTVSANGQTITFTYTPISYSVSYNLAGGTIEGQPSTYNIESNAITLPQPTRVGYTFTGWTGSNGNTPQQSVVIAGGSTGNKSYTANWKKNTYSITYDYDHGTMPESYTVTDTITFDYMPSKTGYSFRGWTPSSIAAGTVGNKSVVSNWKANNYSIFFDADYDTNGSVTGTTAASVNTYDTAKKLTKNGFAKKGYHFTGWATQKGGEPVYQDEASVKNLTTEDGGVVTLYATFQPNDYKIVLHSRPKDTTGDITRTLNAVYDTELNIPKWNFNKYGAEGEDNELSEIQKTGYSLTGWTSEDAAKTSFSNNEKVVNLTATENGTVNLYPVWEANSYDLSFNANGGTLPSGTSKKTVTYDEAIGEIPTPTYKDDVFKGWFLNGGEISEDTVWKWNADGIAFALHELQYTIIADKNLYHTKSGKYYTIGPDGMVGTDDDRLIYPGADREYGTDDDFVYTQDDQMRGDKVYAGADGIFTSSGEYQKSSDDWTYLSSKNDLIMHPGADNNIETQDDNDVWWTGVDKKTGQTDTMADDKLVNAGKDGAYITNDDFIDMEDGSNMRPGADNKFGTEDDFIANNGPDKVAGNADDYIHFEDKHINRRPGEDNAFAASDLKDSGTDDAFYWDGLDKTPGTDDDVAIYAGDDNECGTPDDFYVFTKAPYKGTSVFAGEDGLFGTEDDFARLPDGTVLHPGADALLGTIDDFKQADDGTRQYPGADLQFGTDDDRYQTVDEIAQSLNHDKDGVRYENGADKVPGSEDDVRIQTDPDGAEYIPGTGEETGNKQYPGIDKEYNSEDDKWQSPEEEAKNQNHDKDGNSYTDGADKIPGTEDDELIHAGDPPYADTPDGNKHYPGVDNVFDTEDDRWQTAEEEEKGLNHDKDGNIHSNGADGKPGTADDKAEHTDSAGNVYIEDEDGNRRYPAADDRYYTEDDRFKTPDEVAHGTNHDADGNRYTDGADKKPGTEDDVAITDDGKGEYIPGTGKEEGNKNYPGEDGNYGTDDDKWQTPEEEQKGENHDKDGDRFTNGEDGKPGTSDDVEIRQDENGNDYIVDADGNRRYPAKDETFGTEDDRFKTESEVQDKTNHDADGNRYTDGADKIPGTEDDIAIRNDGKGEYIPGTGEEEGNKNYPGKGGEYGTDDDKWQTPEEEAAGKNHDKDGNQYLDGSDGKPGTEDDILIRDDGKGEYIPGTGEEEGNKNYPGKDGEYGTDDDKWQTPEEEQKGQNHDKDGNRYDNGPDGKPGTEDDALIQKDENGNDYIVDADGSRRYPATDDTFHTEDDRFKTEAEVARGENHDADGNRYLDGSDKKPGTEDDIAIHDDGKGGYIPGTGEEEGNKNYPGVDKNYGTDDDKWQTPEEEAKNQNHDKDGNRYDNGPDGKPGTEDDVLIRDDGKGEYIPGSGEEEGNKQYPGKDGEYGSEDDRYQTPEEETKNQNHDGNGNRYDNGPDGKPGTEDDILIEQDKNGNDYIVDADGNRRYPAADDIFHTEDDRFKTDSEVENNQNHDKDGNRYTDGADKKPGTEDDIAIRDDGKGEYIPGTGEEEGNKNYPGKDGEYGTDDDKWQTPEEEQKGQNHDKDGNHFTNGEDGKPATDDDEPVLKDENGNDYIVDENGDRRYPGKDENFYTEDDRYKSETDVAEGTNHDADGNRFTDGADKIPGTADDLPISSGENGTFIPGTGTEEGNKQYPGEDGIFGSEDDRYQNPEEETKNQNHDGSGNRYDNGPDGKPGTADDILIQKDENGNDYITDSDGRRHYPGADGIFSHPGADGAYGETDDRWKTESDIRNGYNRDKDDVLYRDGKDNIPGTEDDTRVRTGGSSGGSSGSGSRGSAAFNGFAVTGTWEIVDAAAGKWTYRFTNGNTPKDAWLMLYWKDTDRNDWYHFDAQGIMQTGWFMDKDGTWYHLHTQSDGKRGSMDTGWFYEEEDKHWYYLGTDGKMKVGWQKIGEEWYYLNEQVPANTWALDLATGRYTYTAKGQRPYGSMYAAEVTPDGYSVNEAGKWVK